MTDDYEIVTASVVVRPRGASIEDDRVTTVQVAEKEGAR